MQILKRKNYELDFCISQALGTINRGGIVAYPTETFYGIGVRYDNEKALKKLYDIKGRPTDKALPLIIGSREMLGMIATDVSAAAEVLMKRFWPGPLTIIFRALSGLPSLVTAGTGKVAVRIPGESFALSLARAASFPITATSANISGLKPAYDPLMIAGYFSNVLDLLIDDGRTPGELPSTLVDTTGPDIVVLRQGVIPEHDIRAALD